MNRRRPRWRPVPVGVAWRNSDYIFYTHPAAGETTALLRGWGNVLENPRLGLYGAIVIGPKDSAYRHPATGVDADDVSSWRVDVKPISGPAYSDFIIFTQDAYEVIGIHIRLYSEEVAGVVALNFGFTPLNLRKERIKTQRGPTWPLDPVVFNSEIHGDPARPLMEALARDGVKLHVLAPFSERSHIFTVEGHRWPLEPGVPALPLVGRGPDRRHQSDHTRVGLGGR